MIAHEEIACPMGYATRTTSNTAMGSPTIHPETLDVLVIGARLQAPAVPRRSVEPMHDPRHRLECGV